MMKALKIAIAAACLLLVANFTAAAQDSRPGYIYFDSVIEQMPKYAKATKDLDAYKKSFDDMAKVIELEYTSKAKDLDAKRSKMSDEQLKKKEDELDVLKGRLEEYKEKAKDKIQEKKDAETAPFLDEVITAVQAVAKEKSYTYVIDSSKGVTITPATVGDFMIALKLKLGLK